MSDDEADPELLELLRQSLGLGAKDPTLPPDTGILQSAEYISDNSIDVSIVSGNTKIAASTIWHKMQEKGISTGTWSEHELHPKAKDESTCNFIFTMDLLNFCFWSELDEQSRFQVDFRDRKWTGYWSLVAILQRALEEGIPITTPSYWVSATDDDFRHVFRSSTVESMPLLEDRITLLREMGQILENEFDSSVAEVIGQANNSAARLVNLLVEYFPGFRDEHRFHGKTVRIHKRAQILASDLWAAFDGADYGKFNDIDRITIFADYRIPQMLQSLGVLWYSPRLESKIKRGEILESGSDLEIEIRGSSIWAVELLKREMIRQYPEAKDKVNAVLIDFFLYDTCKEQEAAALKAGTTDEILQHHRTRSIWY